MNNYHGKSIRVFFSKSNSFHSSYKNLNKLLSSEIDLKLNDLNTYKVFQDKIQKYKKNY